MPDSWFSEEKMHKNFIRDVYAMNAPVNNFSVMSVADLEGVQGVRGGSLEPPSGAEFFDFHGEFQNISVEIRQTNPPFLHLNPFFRNP